jgi:hypothetical protein
MSYFLTSVIIKDDFKTQEPNFLRDAHLYQKRYPLGWQFFSYKNVETILKNFPERVTFADIQPDMQYIYQIHGAEEGQTSIENLNAATVKRFQSKIKNAFKRQQIYYDYMIWPLRGGIIKNPVPVNSRDFRSLPGGPEKFFQVPIPQVSEKAAQAAAAQFPK